MRTGVEGFQGQRLSQLRTVHNLTLSELGEQVGRSSSTVSAWEKGAQLPEVESFDRLCRVFSVSRMWFLRPVPTAVEEKQRPYFFRNQAAAYKQARERSQLYLAWLQEISDFFQDAMDWPEVNVPILDTDDCRLISDEDIEEIARECRETWKLGTAPIPNVIQVMENAGIICTRATLGHVKMDGVSHVSILDDRPYVLIAEDKANAIRNRFDAAHELGHVVLHSRIPASQYTKNELYDLLEAQAHRFASAFLMPPESFSQEVVWPTLDNLLSLKPRWKVSVAAMIVRCRDLSLLSDQLELRLWKGRSARKWTKGEPGDDAFEFEQPKLMMRGAHLLVDNGIFDRAELVHQIGLSPETIEMLCNLRPGYLSAQPEAGGNVVPLKLKHNAGRSGRATRADVLPFQK
ncbi:Zn-dependent peptidase ImmA, M78 family [Franzmannia pantelleriensis]|uniref:Zn-dependent peptidase ImmA, M78 family n=1 Tax=Franzmannia pantelleriensis TaxID=48727 RepID=A0A1G9R954_9GAMM|nr:XRE family transcriptional regulator [Halomonas pantelleriensis]SDM18955.1 Zn-dependent peptidase ImmA, M78 family [Halomonas pantelleriensis]